MVQSISTLEEFKSIIQNAERAVVIDFWATWCGPCKLIGPVFEKFSQQFPGADYYKVDVDQCTEIAQEVGVRSMPTFIAFKGGERVKEVTGANPGALQAMIQSVQA